MKTPHDQVPEEDSAIESSEGAQLQTSPQNGPPRENSALHLFGMIGLTLLLGILWLESKQWDKEVNQKRLEALIIAILLVHGSSILLAPGSRARRGLFLLSLILLGLLALIELGSFFWG